MDQRQLELIASTLVGLPVDRSLLDESNQPLSINGVLSGKTKGSQMRLSIESYLHSRLSLTTYTFDELIDSPPKFRRRKESEGRVLWYTQEEVNKLSLLSTDVFMRDDLRDIILFAAYTGMRQGEILKIRKKDIDLVANKIHVGGVPTQQTKSKNWRAIPIHDKIMDIVVSRCSQSSRSDVQLFGDEWRDKDQLLRAFRKVNRLLPKEDSYVFHTLRHSYATWLAEAGVPIRSIMALCGHKRIETTLRYAKATDAALTDAMAAI